MCLTQVYVKGVIGGDEPTENYHLTLQFPSAFSQACQDLQLTLEQLFFSYLDYLHTVNMEARSAASLCSL